MKSHNRKLHTVIAVNVLVFLGLLSGVAFIPPAIVDAYRLFRSQFISPPEPRSELPNYADSPWAERHFREFARLRSQYYDYIVWRREPFDGETIHVDTRGYRRHAANPNADFPVSSAWFFGGSTMWGYGVRDSETIPAFVQKASGIRSFNFGEAGYVAHQSLNLLMKAYLEGGRPKYVIFYDGVNEVSHKCMKGQSVFSTFFETPIKKYVADGSRQDTDSLFLNVFSPTIKTIQLAVARFTGTRADNNGFSDPQLYECGQNTEKARAIAAALLQDWTTAKTIVESNGGKFVPVLQPVAYIGRPNLTYLDAVQKNDGMRIEYQLVYAEIRKQLKEQNFRYLDFSEVLDGAPVYYIDQCHVSPNANKVIAERIAALLH